MDDAKLISTFLDQLDIYAIKAEQALLRTDDAEGLRWEKEQMKREVLEHMARRLDILDALVEQGYDPIL